ncbi:MAG TPA: hypothetical protein VMR46_00295 [Candidatus Paceibacterota bacterium]|nr:hypothetical protein [Candidatus Paceibacterota bacterium]
MKTALLQNNRSKRDALAFARLWSQVMHGEGFIEGHIHGDRVGTYTNGNSKEGSGGLSIYIDAPLWVKQDAIGVLHRSSAYEDEELFKRMEFVIQLKMAARESQVFLIVDCSDDIDGRAFRAALKLRKKYAGKITINVAVYAIFGIKTWQEPRWLHLQELAPKAQFIVALPERDGRGDHPVGFEGHIALLYELAIKHKLPLHVHVDQTNTPGECGTQRLINVVRALAMRVPPEERPIVSAVHMLIDGKEDNERVEIISHLKELNMRVECCPHAAASMRQMRNHLAPLHPPVAPVRECLVAGVPVGLGTDNTKDLLMPLPEFPLVLREMDILASLIRYYDKTVLWKIARREPLNDTDRASVAQNLARDYDAFGLPNPWTRFTR